MIRSCPIARSVIHTSMPNLSSLSTSMNGQRTSQKKFGTLTMFRKIGSLTESVRTSFQSHLDFCVNIFALIHAVDVLYASSVLRCLYLLEHISMRSAWTIFLYLDMS